MPAVIGLKFQLRVEDLPLDFGLECTCRLCDHVSIVPAGALRRRFPGHMRLDTLSDKLRCSACGNQFRNEWTIVRRVDERSEV